jgi:hypothetical protein
VLKCPSRKGIVSDSVELYKIVVVGKEVLECCEVVADVDGLKAH